MGRPLRARARGVSHTTSPETGMTRTSRPRRLSPTLLAGAIALGLSACASTHPNSIFTRHTEFNSEVFDLHNILFILAGIVFVLVEALLLYVIVKFRRRPGQGEPKHVHGNTTLEVLWTAIPAVILLFIAVPTVRSIFRTQAKAVEGALQVEVIGHQWWWEFRYPEYNITTANELYLPTGRTVNFALKTADVLHSFWIPQLGGKRDLISNHTNYLWMTPDSVQLPEPQAFNGHCAEYCGASHANMKFRVYTVPPAQFASWVALQQSPAAFAPDADPSQTAGPATAGAAAAAAATASQAGAQPSAQQAAVGTPPVGSDAASRSQSAPTQGAGAPPVAQPGAAPAAGQPGAQPAVTPVAAGTAGYTYPIERLPAHVKPSTKIPAGLTYDENLRGDPARGKTAFMSCIGCHYINGNRLARGVIGPNLTHIGTRNTIAGGLFPNDTRHLALWIKNSRAMKPGVTMPTLGLNQVDPVTKMTVKAGGLTDQQIADIVAYLQALK